MENNTDMHGKQVNTTRVVYAGNTPHALTVKNLTKLNAGTIGVIVDSYLHERRYTVYVVKFNVGETDEFAPTLVFAFMSATSFLLASQ